MLAIVVVSTWRWWSYVMVLDDMPCVEVMLSAKRRWRKKSMVLEVSWRKGLYHITYIKLPVMLILFIACFDCALVVILIGWSLLKYQEVRALPTVQPSVINATRGASCHTSTNGKVTKRRVDWVVSTAIALGCLDVLAYQIWARGTSVKRLIQES